MIYLLMFFLWFGLLTIFICSFAFKKIKRPTKRPFACSIFYGLSCYIYDKSLFILSRFSLPYKITSSKIYLSLRYLYPGENTLLHYENLIISWINHIILIYVVGVILITAAFVNSLFPDKITRLDRPDFDEVASLENLQVSVGDGDLSDITISLEPRKLSNDEIIEIFDSLDTQLLAALLNENKNLEHIDMPLNFTYSLSNEYTGNASVIIDWSVSDNTLINYNGQLNYENISDTGSKVTIYAELKLEGYEFTAIREFNATLFPYEKDSFTLLTEDINTQLNTPEIMNISSISLPTEYLDQKLSFYQKTSDFPVILIPLFAIVLILVVFSKISDLRAKAGKRNAQLLHDYPEIVSKLTLLYCAGLSIRSSFGRIVADYETSFHSQRYAYEEMKLMLKSIENGSSEGSAYIEFGHNCTHSCYIKLGSLLAQSLKRGSGEIYSLLEYEAIDSLQEKKSMIKIAGEKASTKALFPMVLMLLVVFVIIMAPAFMSI